MRLICVLPLLIACRCFAESLAIWRTGAATFGVDAHGSLTAITRTDSGRNLLAPGQPAPVLQLRVDGKWETPEVASWDARRKRLTLRFTDVTAIVSVVAKSTHLAMEVLEIQPAPAVELALWGPYPITIGETIGEIVGVVRDRSDAVGIQALNAKTLGGYPAQENDVVAEFSGDDTGYYPGLPAGLLKGQGFRGNTARPAAFGSVLQAYTRNRNRERVAPNWSYEKYRIPPFSDGGLVGSRIALFAGPESRALTTIGEIEVSEGLPHPMIDGVWAKLSPGASASYLIVDFSEGTVDRAIEMTRRAGLRRLYHSSPFSSWGHFTLKTSLFPHGWSGFRACVERARRAGVQIGFHTLSNFITPADSYVTPEPDPRLAVFGFSELAAATDSAATELVVRDAELFTLKSALNTARIGDELVRFAGVSSETPWRLLSCERGAWGTRPAPHPRGAQVGRLADHGYNVFLGDASLSQEVARNIARFCNETGARQLSFDGLEGNFSTGYGQYGRTLFVKSWYDALDSQSRGKIINDASNPGHFNWHVNTRMNWGEPWYAGFRESQTLYRFKNQVLFERNLMPHMLGWFALRPDTSIEDAEWLAARAAGFDAGFALATSVASTAQLEADPASADTARRFGATTEILATLNQWETARMAGAFTPEAKARLRDSQREFHLHATGSGRWALQEAFVARFIHEGRNISPTRFEYRNPTLRQPLQWLVQSTAKTAVGGLRVGLGGRLVADLKGHAIPAGGSVRYRGGSEAVIFDASWKEVARIPVEASATLVDAEPLTVEVGGIMPDGANLKVELRAMGPATRLSIR